MEIRSFLAFELPLEIREGVRRASEALRKTSADVRWVRADNIHLTVVFLGGVKKEDLEEIGRMSKTVCQGYGPFDMALDGAGLFPNRGRPRVLWLGLKGDLERISSFRDALQRGLKPFGIKEEKRPFRPHLTLGRFRKSKKMARPLEECLDAYQDLKSPVCPLKELVLFKSTLKPGGAEYTKLVSWPLSGER